MKKDRKRQFAIGNLYDQNAIETHLEKMAQKGWMLKGLQGWCWDFEKCKPKKVRFQVDCFDKASNLDSKPETKTQEYIEYCEACGWKYIFSTGKMQIFSTENMDIPEIQTDDKLKLKAMFKGTRLQIIFWIFFTVMQLTLFLGRYLVPMITVEDYHFFEVITTNSLWQGMGLASIVCFLGFGISAGRMLYFFISNSVRVRKGKKIRSYGYKNTCLYYGVSIGLISIGILVILALNIHNTMYFLFILLIISILVFIIWALGIFTTGKRSNRRSNAAVAVAAFMLAIIAVGVLLAVMDGFGQGEYKVVENETIVADVTESLFARKEIYRKYYVQENGVKRPEYVIEIFCGKFSPIQDKYNKLLLTSSEYAEHAIMEGPDWAKELWQEEQVYIFASPFGEKLCVMTEEYTLLLRGILEQQQVEKLKEAYGL